MSVGLTALLDDIAKLASVASATVDDVAGQAAKAGAKAAGVVIDDTAVTPRYVSDLSPARELPIIARIALGSLRNKLLILLPAALALSFFAPWAITPLLTIGGGYLCYEGVEKLYEALFPHAAQEHEKGLPPAAVDPAALEEQKIAAAITTDFILSAEIMAIALSAVADRTLVMQAAVLAIVGLGITAGVYGAVALIVKADDAGLALARNGRPGSWKLAFGCGLARAMPRLLKGLGAIGTAAMIWIGGSFMLHGLESFGWPAPSHAAHGAGAALSGFAPFAKDFFAWLGEAAASGVAGMATGALLIPLTGMVLAPLWGALRGLLPKRR